MDRFLRFWKPSPSRRVTRVSKKIPIELNRLNRRVNSSVTRERRISNRSRSALGLDERIRAAAW